MFSDYDKDATNQAIDRARAEGFLVGTIVGAGVAAVAALLFAPKSGKELRQDISDQTSNIAHQASEYGTKYYDDAKNQFNKAKDSASDHANLESIKKTARETAENLRGNNKENTSNDDLSKDSDAVQDLQN